MNTHHQEFLKLPGEKVVSVYFEHDNTMISMTFESGKKLIVEAHDVDEPSLSTRVELPPAGHWKDVFLPPEPPYLLAPAKVRRYNPKFGDDRVCECGHPYYRHFDTYEDMAAVGCKYCCCHEFTEAKANQPKSRPASPTH